VIDINVTLSRWPFRRLAGDETPALVAKLKQHAVTQAWTASFDALLHKDIAGVNARLAAECRAHGSGLLAPFGAVNPTLPGWEEDLRRCAEEFRMPGIRLYPNYHGYGLADPLFAGLLRAAAARGLIVQIAAVMEDARTQHPLVRVAPVDLAPLAEMVKREPRARLVLLNWWPVLRGKPLEAFLNAGQVLFDISTVEGIEGVGRLAARLAPERILFGSHYPLFHFEAALLKMQESGLPDADKRKILEENARRLLDQPGPRTP
jgi:predicted TIM-barrel fold metal-dependent hydrolase